MYAVLICTDFFCLYLYNVNINECTFDIFGKPKKELTNVEILEQTGSLGNNILVNWSLVQKQTQFKTSYPEFPLLGEVGSVQSWVFPIDPAFIQTRK
jgi:hypothetical protein